MTSRTAFLALTAAASVRAAGFLDQGCGVQQQQQQGAPSWALDGSRLSAHCNDHICGVHAATALDLNLCLGNDHGKLVARKNGNFADSCRDCQVSNDAGSLICACDDVATGVSRISQFDMKADNTIYNWYGFLSCFGMHDDQTAPHGFAHCGADAPAPGVRDPMSCDACVSAPVVGNGNNNNNGDQGAKAASSSNGRRAVRPQWWTPAADQVKAPADEQVKAPAVDQIKAPAVDQIQASTVDQVKALAVEQAKAAQKGDNDYDVKVQQEPKRSIVSPQVKAPAVNGDERGSFVARRSNGPQGKAPAEQINAPADQQVNAPADRINAPADQINAPGNVDSQRPEGYWEIRQNSQGIWEPHYSAVPPQNKATGHYMSPMEHAAYMHQQGMPSVRRSSIPPANDMNAALMNQIYGNAMKAASKADAQAVNNGVYGGFPRPMTAQRQVIANDANDKNAQVAPRDTIEQPFRLGGGPVEGAVDPRAVPADNENMMSTMMMNRPSWLGGGPANEVQGPAGGDPKKTEQRDRVPFGRGGGPVEGAAPGDSQIQGAAVQPGVKTEQQQQQQKRAVSRVGGGPVDGMGPAVFVVDGRL